MNKYKLLLILTLMLCILLQNSDSTNSQTRLFNMSYLYFGSLSSYIHQVDKTKGSLNVVAPNYFDITKEGQLDITWRLQSSFIAEMHKRGVRVVPFLANHWDQTAGINGLINREKLAKDIALAIEQYNLDGVNVDIEGVGHGYRDAHTELVRLLREYIPSHKEVSVAVAANPSGWNTGWHGFYDYQRLSNHADYLMIMAYDESWESPESPIGPVSSLSFFERSIKYAINQGVPKSKIVAGLPFYGRIWKLDGPTLENRSITGLGLSSLRVDPLIQKFNGKLLFDDKTQSAYATFKIPTGQSFFLGSAKLTEGDYVIWYENEQSIKAKLRVPNQYGIKGTGSWALYHETPNTWDYYTLWLNSTYFTDVPIGNWAEANINHVSQKGWMKGTTSTTFSPNSTLTRAQGAVILVRALENENYEPKSYQFKDTVRHWAQKEIETARELGYLHGKTSVKFDPNSPLTREQLAKILYNIFDYPLNENIQVPFTDVPIEHWSYEPILAIYQQGHIKGYDDDTFRPRGLSTRAQMAALMDRMSADFENRLK
ncbi:S-layer homology domain-containing protein [Bacillus luteolus]|uniref:S-layer homology domain-containing protein n=1 Tax=Litchfieldia luteola TaxID=682179 RepID=A0ABR9QJ90_9BACI|nr:glycosyl hydrolase family 18 protein [Cytobacillus luteolus]MBE4908577.1 S-layer homology domain-containing protein [Cytobacillus luteolus]MBP1941432.1 spore germination protein YaaH [Cytobacillus luteolus]